jgi:hypothetical protein
MSELKIDRYILLNKNNKSHEGFKIKNLTTIIYIKSFAMNIINEEKLDFISVFLPLLYGFDKLESIIHRFELNKKKISFNKFVFSLLNFSNLYNQKLFESKNVRDKKIFILKLIWKMRCSIYPNNKTFFENDKIPFNWYKLALFHIIPLNKIDEIDLCKMNWPKIPINRRKLEEIYTNYNYIKINQLIKIAEQFWVNNDFQSSTNQIIIFLKTIQDGDDKI